MSKTSRSTGLAMALARSAPRFNTPSKAEGNWQWRYSTAQLDALHRQSATYLRELGELYGRG